MDTLVLPPYKHRKPKRSDWAVAEILAHPLRLAGILTAAIATGTFVFGISQPTLDVPAVPRVNAPAVLPSSHPLPVHIPQPQQPKPAPRRHPFVPAPKQQVPAATPSPTPTPSPTATKSHSSSPTSSPSHSSTPTPSVSTSTAPPPSQISSPPTTGG